MIWKPKERKLTVEEAVELARQELKPFWFGTTPLLAGVRIGERATAHPLDAAIAEKTWLLLLLDPTDFSGLGALEVLLEWHRRYSTHQLSFLAIARFPFPHPFDHALIEEVLVQGHKLPFALAVDPDGLLAEAFGAKPFPKVLLLEKGRIAFEHGAAGFPGDFEKKLQAQLRQKDPGLPLLAPLSGDSRARRDVAKVDFAASSAAFKFEATQELQAPFPEKTIYLKGQWQRAEGHIVSHDPAAEIGFNAPGSRIALIATALKRSMDPCQAVVQVEGLPAYDEYYGADLEPGDEGTTHAVIGPAWHYDLLKGLRPGQRNVQIQFQNADKTGIALYGLRFAD